MTDKERLEDIKERFVKYEYDYNLNGEDVEWLIQQAERVDELEKDKNEYIRWWKDEARLGNELRDENQRYKQALEEIARDRFPGASYKARKALERDND